MDVYESLGIQIKCENWKQVKEIWDRCCPTNNITDERFEKIFESGPYLHFKGNCIVMSDGAIEGMLLFDASPFILSQRLYLKTQ